jgi:hypothetical protein
LFPIIKEKLKDIQMVDEEDLFYRFAEYLTSISCKELDKVFDPKKIEKTKDIGKGRGSHEGSQREKSSKSRDKRRKREVKWMILFEGILRTQLNTRTQLYRGAEKSLPPTSSSLRRV